ncbi:MAG: glycosyltransferase family 87 protein [candidate division WWE3 bacterium]|nr:glycosyltransferase family 87 protein [candidate division WWE3 bacterium]
MPQKNRYVYILLIVCVVISGLILGGLLLRAFTGLVPSDFYCYYYIPKAVLNLVRREHPYINYAPIFPYFFPPASILLFKPLILLPMYLAKIVWSLTNASLMITSAILVSKVFKRLWLWPILVFLAVIYYPFQFTLTEGQFNIILLFVYTFGLWVLVKWNRVLGSTVGGVLLAIGTITKVSPLLIIAYAFWKKRWLLLVVSLFTVVALCGLAEIYVKSGINNYYLHNVLKYVSDQAATPSWRDQSLLGFIKRFDLHMDEFHIAGHTITESRARSLISYGIIGLLIAIFLGLDLRRKKGDLDVVISCLFLTTIGVLGTGLAWYHQYTMLLLPIWGLLLFSLFTLRKPYNYLCLLISVITYILTCANLEGRFLGLLQPNMFYGGVILTIFLLILKGNQHWFKAVTANVPVFKVKTSLLVVLGFILIISVLVGIGLPRLDQKLKEARDVDRLVEINYMGNMLTNHQVEFKIGYSNSILRSEKLDEGYILFEKDQHIKVRSEIAILFLDPINNHDYNYQFSSADGHEFKLWTHLESVKYISIFGKYYYYNPDSQSPGQSLIPQIGNL